MKSPVLLLVVIILGIASIAPSQKPANSPAKPVENFILKKQIFVDDIESQLSSVTVAGVRVGIRSKLAEWLWKNGKDDTGRAEALAVKAVEELYEKEDEIENPGWLRGPLFLLLEKNAKETAARLKAKYFKNAEDDLGNAYEWMSKPGGDKIVADKVIKYLSGKVPFDSNITYILRELQAARSPQYPIVLAAILQAVEVGRVSLDVMSLGFLASDFREQAVPAGLARRYFELVLARARGAVQTPGPENQRLIYLLAEIISGLGEKVPDLVPEAEGLKASLVARTSRAEGRKREAEERIQASADKLSALIDEAEKAEALDEKNSFYVRAEILAFETEKFAVAIGIITILRDLNKDNTFYSNLWSDQELGQINKEALEKDELETALKARELITDQVKRGEGWKDAALYFAGKKNQIDADDALNKAIKILSDADRENRQRIHALIRLVPAVQKVDKVRLQEVIVLTAKAINDLPTPGPDDKPGTENFKKYIVTVMAINVNLNSIMNSLLKEGKAEAAEFAGRIQKREVRVMADMLIGIDALETAQKAAEKKAVSK